MVLRLSILSEYVTFISPIETGAKNAADDANRVNGMYLQKCHEESTRIGMRSYDFFWLDRWFFMLFWMSAIWFFPLGQRLLNGEDDELIKPDQFSGKTVSDVEQAVALMQHREKQAPEEGARAPNVSVFDEKGKLVKLSTFWVEKPVLLVFGSITCDHSAASSEAIIKLYNRYSDQLNVVMVYIREAHPANGFKEDLLVKVPAVLDPLTSDSRLNVAKQCKALRKFPYSVVTDNLDDLAAIAYAAWPARYYIVDQNGKVAYKSRIGPWGLLPTKELSFSFPGEFNRETLQQLLNTGRGESVEEFLEGFLVEKEAAAK